MTKRRVWAVAISVLGWFAVPGLGLGCSGSTPVVPNAWCCDLIGSSWSCTAECASVARCPSGVAYQETCSADPQDGPACTQWSCSDADVEGFGDAGPPPPPPPPPPPSNDAAPAGEDDAEATAFDAGIDGATIDAGLDAPAIDAGLDAMTAPSDAPVYRSNEAGLDATLTAEASVADAGAVGPCGPGQQCDGITSCSVSCYGPACCQLSCACEDPFGSAADPDDPSAHLACTATCP